MLMTVGLLSGHFKPFEFFDIASCLSSLLRCDAAASGCIDSYRPAASCPLPYTPSAVAHRMSTTLAPLLTETALFGELFPLTHQLQKLMIT